MYTFIYHIYIYIYLYICIYVYAYTYISPENSISPMVRFEVRSLMPYDRADPGELRAEVLIGNYASDGTGTGVGGSKSGSQSKTSIQKGRGMCDPWDAYFVE